MKAVLSQRLTSLNHLRLVSQRFCSSSQENAKTESSIIEDSDGRPTSDPVAAAFFSPSVQVHYYRKNRGSQLSSHGGPIKVLLNDLQP
jgi:hypothetical protein